MLYFIEFIGNLHYYSPYLGLKPDSKWKTMILKSI